MKILMIDDSIHERKRHRLMLMCGNITCDVIETENGQEGLDVLQANAADIGLILLDWHMPIMDGAAFLQEFLKHPEWSRIRIIMTTTYGADERKAYIRQIYPNLAAYIVKPYVLEDMIQTVKRIMNPKT